MELSFLLFTSESDSDWGGAPMSGVDGEEIGCDPIFRSEDLGTECKILELDVCNYLFVSLSNF